MRPRIALTTYDEHTHWGVWARRADVLPSNYARAVYQAGGCPVLLPTGYPDAAHDALQGIDGLVVTGGPDIGAQPPQPHSTSATASVERRRDHWETALPEEAARRDLPTLGICRGMQLMNICLGGTLHQHLPDVVGHEGHQIAPGVFSQHRVQLASPSALARILGQTINVATYHHQAVDKLGRGVAAVGWADDGTIEAIELPDRSFAAGVQWHPEESEDVTLFAALVEHAASAVSEVSEGIRG
jgi:gamma-glutamyl-gamma-aminobutyrate hydrolase PuuD